MQHSPLVATEFLFKKKSNKKKAQQKNPQELPTLLVLHIYIKIYRTEKGK